MSDAAPLIRVDQVSITHRDAVRPTPAWVSFTVERGEALLILGPSGCGKSTLALALNGLIPKDVWATVDGTIELAGDDLSSLSMAEASARVAMVFQDPDAQIVTSTVFDEVVFGAENLCVPAAEVEARVERALRSVGLWNRHADSPDVLSGGGRQRLAIAAAIAQGSPLVVLDEPTANLDPRGAREVYDVLGALVAAGEIGVVLVEHNLDEALRVATRVLVLDQSGRPVLSGTPREVFLDAAPLLSELGVWQPVAALAGGHLRDAGLAVGTPLTIAELRAGVLGLGVAAGSPEPLAPRATEGSARAAAVVEPATSEPATSEPTASEATAPEPITTKAPAQELASDLQAPASLSLEPHLVVRELKVVRAGRILLDRVSLTINRGAFVAVVGPNGAGKTTLLQSLAGIETPPRGTVRVDDRDLARLRARELRDRIGYVFQNPEHQFLASTVRDELSLELRTQGFDVAAIDARVAASLERFGLDEVAELHPFLLSGGQKRRLSVATALVSGAPCLVLDEPTFGQDRARAAELVAVLAELHATGTTIIMATHDLQLAADVADQLVVVDEARIAASGPTAEVIASGVLEAVGLDRPPLAQAFRDVPGLREVIRMRDLPGVTS
ncbi:ATP-binding cassette domain-containing protein [Gulosibacter macacae]|uniref:ATP-binding cassette domain-containing protein n=1 Tax=Gulosibacter macacae TaxID=2488791 RepID=A0A3P3VX65_9MICO|nr:ABC transporter ATP-binding protein [Gulosibacter macacae]RRJ87054.1 ATP-binding cassette domain-containing protein [Gulosibacter macacae]